MSKKIISFPHIGEYSYFAKYYFETISDCTVKLAPPITKKTVELGNKYSPDFICFPFKYNLGNYIETLENEANILFQLGGGCRYGNYGTLQKEILKDLGYNFEFYNLINLGKLDLNRIYRIFKDLNPSLRKYKFFIESIKVMLKIVLFDKTEHYRRKKISVKKDGFYELKNELINKLKDEKSLIKIIKIYFHYMYKYRHQKTKKPKLKIGIIGELFTSIEPYSTFNLEKILKQYDVSIKRYTDASFLLIYKKIFGFFMFKKCKRYLKYKIGADATYNVYRVIDLNKKGFDGIIHTKPFGCTPEVGATPILAKIANDLNIPIMFLSFDTNTSNEGIKTRIEAFIDMLNMRKEKENE